MLNIKYICLSDLHLGSPSALLMGDAAGQAVADDLRDTFAKSLVKTVAAFYPDGPPATLPGIVLLGDIFDLSLGTPRAAIDGFDAFIKALKKHGAQKWLGVFIFVPGNHDHELWTVTRFNHMARVQWGNDGYVHTTRAFCPPNENPVAALVDQVLRDNGFPAGGNGPPASTYYPNMGLISPDGRRVVVLHHGHYVEAMYRVVSNLTAALEGMPDMTVDAETLERLNASWIDFIWSSAGDNGLLGAEVGRAHDALLTGGKDIRFNRRLARVLTEKLSETLPLPRTSNAREWLDIMARAAVDGLLGSASQMERFSYQIALGTDGLAGLKSYLSDTVLRQFADEVPGGEIDELTFVFGHTHKPFESRLNAPGFKIPPAIYNTGGWDVDTPIFGTRLGAAAVFIDEDLNVASLRLCDVPRDADHPAPSKVRVATADGVSAGNPLAEGLEKAIDATRDDWQAFAAVAVEGYRSKQRIAMSEGSARVATAGADHG